MEALRGNVPCLYQLFSNRLMRRLEGAYGASGTLDSARALPFQLPVVTLLCFALWQLVQIACMKNGCLTSKYLLLHVNHTIMA